MPLYPIDHQPAPRCTYSILPHTNCAIPSRHQHNIHVQRCYYPPSTYRHLFSKIALLQPRSTSSIYPQNFDRTFALAHRLWIPLTQRYDTTRLRTPTHPISNTTPYYLDQDLIIFALETLNRLSPYGSTRPPPPNLYQGTSGISHPRRNFI